MVALMEITTGDKGEKVEWVDLWATGDAATKLDDLASKHAKVTVTGLRTADGIKVTAVGDDAKIPAAKGKKKNSPRNPHAFRYAKYSRHGLNCVSSPCI